MLQQVVLQTADPMTLNIDSVDPDEIIVIESISGLDPADVTLFTGDFARDGGYYQGRRSSGRNPVFNLKLNPNYADDIEVSDIREMLYDMFLEPSATDDGLTVVLIDDRKPDRYFIGYTEKLPADIFSKETKAQVSMLCVDPFLKSVDAVDMTEPAGWLSHTIVYDGSARTGLEMTFKVLTAVNQLHVTINGIGMTLVKPTGTFAVNDILIINTVIGERAIKWNGTDIMAMLSADSIWLQLNKGDNDVVTYGAAPGDGKIVMTGHAHRAAWWGI